VSDLKEIREARWGAAGETGISSAGQAALRGEPPESPSTRAEESRLARAAVDAAQQVPEHVATQAGERVERYKLRGRLGEALAETAMPGSVNINDVTGTSNFANFDVVSRHEMASVKVKERRASGDPRYGDYDKYFRDISNPDSRTNQRAAADLRALREQDPGTWATLADHLPEPAVSAGDTRTLALALTERAALRISGDQVREVRAHLFGRAVADPVAYGLDPAAEPAVLAEQTQRLVRDRVKPLDPHWSVDDLDTAALGIQAQRRAGRERGSRV
jgi:hypothetical protein